MEHADLRDAEDAEAEVAARLAEEAARPYDLAEGPLFRAVLLRTADDVHVLSLVLHRILTDEQSTGLLLAQFVEAYDRRLHGLPAAAAPRLQYADYAVWQRAGQGDGAAASACGGACAGCPACRPSSACRPTGPGRRGRRAGAEPSARASARTCGTACAHSPARSGPRR
ncbi:condensation domain-containing protein [Streptomyces tricolor]|nr:condensation domain-containing protein [Streptomyces tricolor]